jgi:hypothetical protein
MWTSGGVGEARRRRTWWEKAKEIRGLGRRDCVDREASPVTHAQGHVIRMWKVAETTLLITCGFVRWLSPHARACSSSPSDSIKCNPGRMQTVYTTHLPPLPIRIDYSHSYGTPTNKDVGPVVAALKQRDLRVRGTVFNGKDLHNSKESSRR